VLGLDGVPHSFIERSVEKGILPHFRELLGEGSFRRMYSVIPTVSSVAWSTYMTGKNPGKHGIYGFIDRQPGSYEMYIPLATHMRGHTLWEILSQEGKSVVVINVPVTYPPRTVRGILISGFLATKIDKATYPKEVAAQLHRFGYRIDVDPWNARQGKMDDFVADLNTTLTKRFETAFYYMEKEDWDFFQLHVMETDRINHFLWDVTDHQEAFLAYYTKIDAYLGELRSKIDSDTTLIVLSDHGFCGIESEIDLNFWLSVNDYLLFRNPEGDSLNNIDRKSRAYSLPPGRLYVNDQPTGEEIRDKLLSLTDPETGRKIIKNVFTREDLYEGEMAKIGPDLVAVPYDGFDLKASFQQKRSMAGRTPIVGMHTYDDAFIYIRQKDITREGPGIVDVMPTILALMDVPTPLDLDGSSCI